MQVTNESTTSPTLAPAHAEVPSPRPTTAIATQDRYLRAAKGPSSDSPGWLGSVSSAVTSSIKTVTLPFTKLFSMLGFVMASNLAQQSEDRAQREQAAKKKDAQVKQAQQAGTLAAQQLQAQLKASPAK